MTTRREVERHLQTLDEIKHIMGSMKTLALLETRKLTGFLRAQRQAVDNIEAMAADFRAFHATTPITAPDAREVHLILGSERGFCGDFNNAVLRALDETLVRDGVADPLLIGVGRRLNARLEGEARLVAAIAGASVAEEVADVLGALVEELGRLQARYGSFRLTVVHHAAEADAVLTKRILPPFQDAAPPARFGHAPRLNLTPDAFFADVLDQYLFASLFFLICTSLMAESQHRMQHLEGAINRLEGQASVLALRRNTLRQEEITEEIEVILLSADVLQQSGASVSGRPIPGDTS